MNPTTMEQGLEILKRIEYAGRTCYQSYDKITEDSYDRFIRSLIKRGHTAPLEFGTMTVKLVTSRAVLAELTRHRLSSFCVESQRYVDESDLVVIRPDWADDNAPMLDMWENMMRVDEIAYQSMVESGMQKQQAREVLPNSTATQIMMSANIREWRHIFNLRMDKAAYPQIRSLMTMVHEQASKVLPVVFEDVVHDA